jgi:hypothetical protein
MKASTSSGFTSSRRETQNRPCWPSSAGAVWKMSGSRSQRPGNLRVRSGACLERRSSAIRAPHYSPELSELRLHRAALEP